MVITVHRRLGVDDDRHEELEFLLGNVRPVLARLRESHARLSREGDVAGEAEVFDRLLAARKKLSEALGEALIEHIGDGGRVEIEP